MSNYLRFYPLVPNCERDTVVFYYPTMESVAENYILNNEDSRLGTIIWSKFKDGTDNIQFENEKYIEDKDVIFFMSLIDGDIFAQISMLKILPRQGIKSLKAYVSFFPTATMERVDEFGPNTLATADTLSMFISEDIPQTKFGPVEIIIYDLHTLHNRFYFRNSVRIVMKTGIDLLLEVLDKDMIIVFPDEGSKKRFGNFFPNHNKISCSKVRNGDKREITCDLSELPLKVKKEKTIIVDDLAQSGGTLIECMRALKKSGFTKVSAYITHVIFPENSHLKFIDMNDGFETIYHTNTNPKVSDRIVNEKFNIHNPFKCLNFEGSKSNNSMTNVIVATTSQVKMNGVCKGCYDSPLYRFYMVPNITSDVSEQPIDLKETIEGSTNRLHKIMKDDNSIYISIENGIDLEGDKAYDFLIFRSGYSGGTDMIMGDKVYFPIEYYNESISTGKTVGELLNRDYGYKKDSWHHHFNKYTREEIIADCVHRSFFGDE